MVIARALQCLFWDTFERHAYTVWYYSFLILCRPPLYLQKDQRAAQYFRKALNFLPVVVLEGVVLGAVGTWMRKWSGWLGEDRYSRQ